MKMKMKMHFDISLCLYNPPSPPLGMFAAI